MLELTMCRPPRREETLSSWLNRRLFQLGVQRRVFDETLGRQYSGVAAAFAMDPDYPKGHLWRNAMESLLGVHADVLGTVGWPSSPWFLMPDCRRSACLICLSEAPYVNDEYVREHWLQSWRTNCAIHQFPLIEVPAVGVAWAMLPRGQRKRHGILMRRPDLNIGRILEQWRHVPVYMRDALFRAEMLIMEAFREDLLSVQRGDEMHGSILVWRDLLAFGASSWSNMTGLAMAAYVLPPKVPCNSYFFRCSNVQPCEDPGIELYAFRTLVNPAARRVCLLAVMDAMYDVFKNERPPKWGWAWFLSRAPQNAREWLQRKSQKWPYNWRAKFAGWLSENTAQS